MKLLREDYYDRKERNTKYEVKLRKQIEEEQAALADLQQRYNDLIKNFTNIVPEEKEENLQKIVQLNEVEETI